jgi:hypothetical protein
VQVSQHEKRQTGGISKPVVYLDGSEHLWEQEANERRNERGQPSRPWLEKMFQTPKNHQSRPKVSFHFYHDERKVVR